MTLRLNLFVNDKKKKYINKCYLDVSRKNLFSHFSVFCWSLRLINVCLHPQQPTFSNGSGWPWRITYHQVLSTKWVRCVMVFCYTIYLHFRIINEFIQMKLSIISLILWPSVCNLPDLPWIYIENKYDD